MNYAVAWQRKEISSCCTCFVCSATALALIHSVPCPLLQKSRFLHRNPFLLVTNFIWKRKIIPARTDVSFLNSSPCMMNQLSFWVMCDPSTFSLGQSLHTQWKKLSGWALATWLEIKLLDFKTSPRDPRTPLLMHYICTYGLHFLDTSIIGSPSSKKRGTIVSMHLICLTWKISHAAAKVSMLGKMQTNLHKSRWTHRNLTLLPTHCYIGKEFCWGFLPQKNLTDGSSACSWVH